MKGALEGTAALAVASPFKSMLTDAAKLQKEMIGIGLATRGNAREMDDMRAVIEKTAGMTMFSNVDVAKMAKQIASGTGWSAAQVSADLPIFAQFADAQQIMKGTPYSESVKTGISLSHLAGYNDPGSISKYLDTLTKASMVVPGGLGEVGQALKYSQAVLKNTMGVSDENSILLVTLLNRMGMAGSRGGTNLIAAMTRSIPGIFGSGLLTGKSAEALKAMGMADASGKATVFTNGKFDALKWMGRLADYESSEYAKNPEATARQNILTNMQRAFGVNGQRVAALLATPQARTALDVVRNSLANGAGTAAVQGTFADQSVYQQFNNAKTNVTSLMSELGYTLLPTASAALKAFNSVISELTDIVRNHPKTAETGLLAVGAGGAALAGGAIINAFRFARRGLSLLGGGSGGAAGTATGAAGGLGGWALGGAATVAGAFGGAFQNAQSFAQRHQDSQTLQSIVSSPAVEALARSWLGRTANSLFSNGQATPPQQAQTVNIDNKLQVDGRTLADIMTKYQVKSMNGPSQGAGIYDGRRSYTPNTGLSY